MKKNLPPRGISSWIDWLMDFFVSSRSSLSLESSGRGMGRDSRWKVDIFISEMGGRKRSWMLACGGGLPLVFYPHPGHSCTTPCHARLLDLGAGPPLCCLWTLLGSLRRRVLGSAWLGHLSLNLFTKYTLIGEIGKCKYKFLAFFFSS